MDYSSVSRIKRCDIRPVSSNTIFGEEIDCYARLCKEDGKYYCDLIVKNIVVGRTNYYAEVLIRAVSNITQSSGTINVNMPAKRVLISIDEKEFVGRYLDIIWQKFVDGGIVSQTFQRYKIVPAFEPMKSEVFSNGYRIARNNYIGFIGI